MRRCRFFLGSLGPAAVAACSPGGSRNNDLELHGLVPTLLLQGNGGVCSLWLLHRSQSRAEKVGSHPMLASTGEKLTLLLQTRTPYDSFGCIRGML